MTGLLEKLAAWLGQAFLTRLLSNAFKAAMAWLEERFKKKETP